jgi:uncharacterized membrane protein
MGRVQRPSAVQAIPSESHLRSVLKGLSWRVVATSTTIVIAGGFLGDWSTALAIGGTEAVAKIFLYYVHERLWQLAPAGAIKGAVLHDATPPSDRITYRESRLRSILKTCSWRLVATSTTMVITWGATTDFTIAAWVGSVEAVSKLFLYYAHERAWQLLPRGTVRQWLTRSRIRQADRPES